MADLQTKQQERCLKILRGVVAEVITDLVGDGYRGENAVIQKLNQALEYCHYSDMILSDMEEDIDNIERRQVIYERIKN